MVQLNPGRTGAKRQSFTAVNPRDLLKAVMAANPNAGEKTMQRRVFDAIMNSPDKDEYIEAIIEYWFANNYRAVVQAAEVEAVPPREREKQRATARAARKEEADALTRITKKFVVSKAILLDYKLPNGKMLRNATFLECRVAGGWLSELGTKGKPTDLVGKVLDEAAIQRIWREQLATV